MQKMLSAPRTYTDSIRISLGREVRSIPLQCGLLCHSCSSICYQGPSRNLLRCVQIYWRMIWEEKVEKDKSITHYYLSSFWHIDDLPSTIEASTIMMLLFGNIISHLPSSFLVGAIAGDVARPSTMVAHFCTILLGFAQTSSASGAFHFGFRFLGHVWLIII